ncbi:hypothetical protein HK096_001155, partial [Nowakowskiella sp. JEL0078]
VDSSVYHDNPGNNGKDDDPRPLRKDGSKRTVEPKKSEYEDNCFEAVVVEAKKMEQEGQEGYSRDTSYHQNLIQRQISKRPDCEENRRHVDEKHQMSEDVNVFGSSFTKNQLCKFESGNSDQQDKRREWQRTRQGRFQPHQRKR